MNKEQCISAIQDAAISIKDPAALHQRLQQILDDFEQSLKSKTLHFPPRYDSSYVNPTLSDDSPTKLTRRRGGQRAIPETLVPKIDNLNRQGRSYGYIADCLSDEDRLEVHRTTVEEVVKRQGVYAKERWQRENNE